QIDGYAPYHVTPNYWGDPDPVRFDENRGTRFSSYFKIDNKGGNVVVTDSTISTIQVKNADEAIVYVSMATSFNGFDKDPVKNGLDNESITKKQLQEGFSKNYQTLTENHLNDYQSFFNRVSLDLNESNGPDLPTDERLKRYSE